ncbi:MAG TPA: PAS domain-containing protein [Methylomirabilota bacterium]|jgi:two-component system sensor kinase FixL|nr:PAS domain-containing protein [Methylomirabilota bacterium]
MRFSVRQWFAPKPVAVLAGLGLVLLLGFIDFASGTEVSFALFYFLPIFIVAWLAGRLAGIFMALTAGSVWLLADVAEATNFTHPWVPYFNLVARSGGFVVVSLLVSAMRELTDTLEERVEQRTNELRTEIAERKRTEIALKESEERFRMFMNNSPAVAFIKDPQGRYLYANPAFERRFPGSVLGKTARDLFPPEIAARLEESDQTVITTGKGSEFFEVLFFPDGKVSYWLNFRFLLKDTTGQIFVGGVSVDVTERRNLERQLLEISDREQARIGQDLHDGLCQVLVSATFDCNLLERRLTEQGRPEAAETRQIAGLLDEAITQARQVARGLYPVKLEADGLLSALEELATNVSLRFKVKCAVECPGPLSLPNNSTATHLYRIAQEAVNNAIRHAHPHNIRIRLNSSRDKLELAVVDDGIGIAPEPGAQGMGLNIMDYRTRAIGGRFQVQPGDAGGTTISCLVPLGDL